MSQYPFIESELGKRLYTLMPEVYRNRDMPDRDQARYLDAHGQLLDLIHQTLLQRLADTFPDNPEDPEALACQDWLIPYFADLLDVQLVSPHVEGQRDEVANAIGWRQRKGTLTVAEEVAEAIGHIEQGVAEAELQEGFQRIAMTARIGFPFRKDPLVTVDFRKASRAVESEPGMEGVGESLFQGQTVSWRHANPGGVPCFPGSYEDVSPRTVDVRTPDWRRGHFHPRRVMLFIPPPTGFFPQQQVRFKWSERNDPEHNGIHFSLTEDGNSLSMVNPSTGLEAAREGLSPVGVTITTSPPAFTEDKACSISDLNFDGKLTFTKGRLVLRRVAVRHLQVSAPAGVNELVVDARDCLFGRLEVEKGTVRIEHCTVMERLSCRRLQASDCILPDDVEGPPGLEDKIRGCLRYTRAPQKLLDLPDQQLLRHKPSVTTRRPAFYSFSTCEFTGDASVFGNPGYGVLHPATAKAITHGAEDGGEMGAYHHKRYCLQSSAVQDKLQDFLPLGIEAVLVPDPRLLTRPPKENSET